MYGVSFDGPARTDANDDIVIVVVSVAAATWDPSQVSRAAATVGMSCHRTRRGVFETKVEPVIEIRPLIGIGEIHPGDDLPARLIAALRGEPPRAGSVLVVTQKVVSKAEGRFVNLAEVVPSQEAQRLSAITQKDPRLVELVLRESTTVLRAVPDVLITRHRLGLVMANAGIDRSNLGPLSIDRVLLLPVDPDASARLIRERVCAHFEQAIAVVISDSFGRPWRNGVVNVAIGAAGLPSLIDRRGQLDRDGRPLEVTEVAMADMIASAAGMISGEGDEGIPAVLLSGLAWSAPDRPAQALVRPIERDLFQ
jgi:coenzyme F420-0:L-glutamate ligase / coenzyme F420-1:gamma-L-glutamate ligase